MFTLNDLLHQLNKDTLLTGIDFQSPDNMYSCVNLYLDGTPRHNILYVCRSVQDLPAFRNASDTGFILMEHEYADLSALETYSCEWAVWDEEISAEELLNLICRVISDPAFSSKLNGVRRILAENESDLPVSQLISRLYHIFGNPIILMDEAYNVIAMDSGKRRVNNPLWYELEKIRAFSPEIIKYTRENGITAAATSENTVLYLDNLKYINSPSILSEIWSEDGNMLGRICVLSSHRQLNNEDSECLLAVANYLSLHMGKTLAKPDYHELKELLLELLNGRQYSDSEISIRLNELGWGSCSYYQLCLMEFPNISHQSYYILQQLRYIDPHVVGLLKDEQLCLLFSSNNPAEFPVLFKKVELFLQHNDLSCGVSPIFSSLSSLSEAAENAQNVLRIGSSIEPKNLYHYKDYLIYLSLSHLNRSDLYSLCSSGSYFRLRQYDQSERTPYCATLLAFLQSGCSFQAAAEKLFIHKSTLVYRVEKIQKLFDIDCRSMDDLLDFYFSYKVYCYYETREEATK